MSPKIKTILLCLKYIELATCTGGLMYTHQKTDGVLLKMYLLTAVI